MGGSLTTMGMVATFSFLLSVCECGESSLLNVSGPTRLNPPPGYHSYRGNAIVMGKQCVVLSASTI